MDLVKECDNFPYPSSEAHASLLSTLYTLVWKGTPIGLLPENVFNAFAKVPTKIKGELDVSRQYRTITAFQSPTEEERSKAVAATCQYWRENKTFKVLSGWRNELYPVYGPGNELLYSIERSASPLFGVVTFGVHMTAYTKIDGELKIWVPRRSKTKQTYPGMLDNTVAGGMATGEDQLESIIREANEEASLPKELLTERVKANGTVTYIYIREARAGGEDGLIQPECQYVYDLELPTDVVCKPNDSEVECFYLWSVDEVKEHLAQGEFKPNCALVMLDFFVRHGILRKENEEDFEEIKRRLHRKLEFPGPHNW